MFEYKCQWTYFEYKECPRHNTPLTVAEVSIPKLIDWFQIVHNIAKPIENNDTK